MSGERFRWLVMLLFIGIGSFQGCDSSNTAPPSSVAKDHDHESSHDHGHENGTAPPTNLMEAIHKLNKQYEAIKAAGEAGNVESAHNALHDVGHTLEHIGTMKDKAELTNDQQAAVSQAVETLFETYGAIDEKLHGGGGKDYNEVSSQIDAAVASLKEIAETHASSAASE